MRTQPAQFAQPASPYATQQPLDVLVTGPVFFDLVFTGLPSGPVPGTEVWASGMGSAPGGIANLAVAASRLGLSTGLAGAFGDDAYADWLWTVLGKQEGVDLSASRRYRHWHTSVTVSLAMENDRAMISHGHPDPEPASALVSGARYAHAVVAELSAEGEPWWRDLAARGTLIFADVGWDPEGSWDPAWLDLLEGCHAFTPNEVEAMAYTRADSAVEAARALAERVPLAVVTRGADGAVAVDSASGEEVEVDPLQVEALDATGAGDVFGAALITGTINGWDLLRRLRFAVLCSALAVRQFGGSLAAPGWGDIADWWEATVAAARTGDRAARETAARYDFLDDALPGHPLARVRRADATMARLADVSTGEGPAPTVRSSM
ncbi:carbohydrate kinase family protein [Bogoriella caseilytica]|uniref:Sugar/nucleoside kinase (Ribokinase family) n=1 Tax=Bogoriella caseilytica TaxID=56055 RepID=A0A3N2BFA9_9MICO|nr:PfkB family carbohydrate kinase [Bogoriella caseilytica]ROR73941.1 sugar/nucleoside kinase (ribokinase family) [Bogoriella caseilytica]